MEIWINDGLEPVADTIVPLIDSVEQEREDLGLSSPDDYNINIQYCGVLPSRGIAMRSDSGLKIHLNMLPLALNKLSQEDADRAIDIHHYFMFAHQLLGPVEDVQVLELMKHPIITMRRFEKEHSSKIEEQKRKCEQRGRKYDVFRKTILRISKKTRENLADIVEKIPLAVKETTEEVLRHEIDHLDFFNTEIYDAYWSLHKAWPGLKEQKKELIKGGHAHLIEQSAEQLLYGICEAIAITEARSLFFSSIKQDEWTSQKIDSVTKGIELQLIDSYADDAFLESMMALIIDKYMVNNTINNDTVNHILYSLNVRRDSVNSVNYIADIDKVDFNQYNELMFRELPLWQHRFTNNSIKAVGAIACAFKEDSYRFEIARSAETFDEYIGVLKGD